MLVDQAQEEYKACCADVCCMHTPQGLAAISVQMLSSTRGLSHGDNYPGGEKENFLHLLLQQD